MSNKEKAQRMRAAKVIRQLYEADHSFISKEGVRHYTEPFGFMGSTYLAKANPQDFKGLSLFDKDGNPISEMEGQAAHILAEEIADKLKLTYPDMLGMGSRLRVACKAILEHLNTKTPEGV